MTEHIPYDQPSRFDREVARMLAGASGLGLGQIYVPRHVLPLDVSRGWLSLPVSGDADRELSDLCVYPGGFIAPRLDGWRGSMGWEMR